MVAAWSVSVVFQSWFSSSQVLAFCSRWAAAAWYSATSRSWGSLPTPNFLRATAATDSGVNPACCDRTQTVARSICLRQ